MQCRNCDKKLDEKEVVYDYIGNEHCEPCLQEETDEVTMNTQEARDYFKEKGLDYQQINEEKLELLKMLLKSELDAYRNSNEPSGKTMDMHLSKTLKKHVKVLKRTGLVHAAFKVDGSYFDGREAITFNRSGFIGFGGEFSTKNVQPMLRAFCKWCDQIAATNGVEQQ